LTIDERLDRLTERHEALTESVESLARTVQALTQSQQRTDRRLNLLYSITLHIGADFAERLRKLEEQDEKEGEG
jgi:prefoldin subunit 5